MKSEMSAKLVTAALLAFSLSACNDNPMSSGPAIQIVISAPSSAVVGDYLNSLTVELRDANGNVATGNADMVTIAMSNDPSGVASFWGTTTVAAVSGVATFDDISIDTPGSGFVLTATSGSFTPSVSGNVDLTNRFTTASNLATQLSGCDDCDENVPIGFTFSFYGIDYTDAWMNTNGTINFGAGCSEEDNEMIPTGGGVCDSFAAPFWDDLNPSDGGDIYYETFGVAPDRTFVVEWRGVAFWTDEGGSTLFSGILYEGSGDVEFEYGAMTSITPGLDYGGSATIGFENQAGDVGLEFSFDTVDAIVEGREMRFAFVSENFVRVR